MAYYGLGQQQEGPSLSLWMSLFHLTLLGVVVIWLDAQHKKGG